MGELLNQKNEIAQIETIEKQLRELNIPKAKREIYLSDKKFGKIRDVEEKDTSATIKTILGYLNITILDFGVNITKEDLDYLNKRVTDEIFNNFSDFTLEDIRLALYYGVRGELGEFYGLNAVSICKWLKNYKYELKSSVQLEISKQLPPPEVKETRSQKELDIELMYHMQDFFEILKSKGIYTYRDYGNIAYNLLKKLGTLDLHEQYKKLLWDKAKGRYVKQLTDNNKRYIQKGQSVLVEDIEKVMGGLENNDKKAKFHFHSVASIAKNIAVEQFFKNTLGEEKTIVELLKPKIEEYEY